MAETSTSASLYGQFGHAVYQRDEKQWHFERIANSKQTFYALGEPKVIVPPAADHREPVGESHKKEFTGQRLSNQMKALVQLYPELQPASHLLPDLARISEAVEGAAAHHDPMKGNLLAFGNITDKFGKILVEVAAFPCGASGSDLRVVEVQKHKQGWDDSKAAWIEVPAFSGEEAVWKGPGTSIQSLTFAKPIGRSAAYLAVRLLTETFIFRPFFREISLPGSSRLDLNLLLSISTERNPNQLCADVTLNPWQTRQFAVIDQAGHWSVQELFGKDARTTKEMSSGNVFDGLAEDSPTLRGMDLIRILWACSSTILAVSTRAKLLLLDLLDAETTPLELLKSKAILENGPEWNLDIAVIPSRMDYLISLTTTQIYIYHVTRDRKDRVSSKMVLCVRHFRNPGDISMRLHIFMDEEDISILIHSELNTEVATYQLNFSNAGHIRVKDPTELPLSSPASNAIPNACFSALRIHCLPLRTRKDVDSDQSLGAWSAEHGVRFYSITALRRDLSVLQHLYFTCSEQIDRLTPPTWEAAPKVSKSSTRAIEVDDFIEYGESEPSEAEEVFHEPVSAYVRHHNAQKAAMSKKEWMLSYELTAGRLNETDVSDVIDVQEILDEGSDILHKGSADDGTPFRTLRELADGEVTAREWEAVDLALDCLQDHGLTTELNQDSVDENEPAKSPRKVVLQTIPLPSFLSLSPLIIRDRLSSIHDSIVRGWLEPVSEDIPEIVQATREQYARRIAVDATLASQVLRLEQPKDAQEPLTQSQGYEEEVLLRSIALLSPARTTPSIYFDASSQPRSARATPAPSQVESAITSSSRPSSASALEILRLTQYTTFSKTVPSFLPKSLNRVLSHWKPDEDPANYDWRATSRNILQFEDTEGEEMTEKERLRLERKSQRYRRRQRREAEDTQRQRMLSSQAPEIVSASQPTQPSRAQSSQPTDAGPSQDTGPSQITASQVMPGRHGSRRPAKKKRKSGF